MSQTTTSRVPVRATIGLLALGLVIVAAVGLHGNGPSDHNLIQVPKLTSAPISADKNASISGSSADVAAIEQQVANALFAEQNVVADPTQPSGADTAASLSSSRTRMQGNANRMFPVVFDSAQQSREQVFVDKQLSYRQAGEPTARVLDGGIDWEHVSSAVVNGSSADVQAQVQTWLSEDATIQAVTAAPGPNPTLPAGVSASKATTTTVAKGTSTNAGSTKGTIPAGADTGTGTIRPTNVLDVKVHLVLVKGAWLVDRVDWTFAPGRGCPGERGI